MKLRDYVLNEENGTPVPGAQVELYKAGATLPSAQTTTDNAGAWEFAQVEPGTYDVKITLPSGKPTFWRKANVAVQAQEIVGLDGKSAPLPPQSVSKEQLRPTAVADSLVTLDYEGEVLEDTGELKTILGSLAGGLAGVIGSDNFGSTPSITLGDLEKHAARHRFDGDDPLPLATQAHAGMLSAADKIKLDGINPGGAYDHHHDDRYAPLGHRHDGEYAPFTHYHDEYAHRDHTHPDGNAVSLQGIGGNNFLRLVAGHTGSTQWTTDQPWRLVIGAGVTAIGSNGVGTVQISYPTPFPTNTLWLMTVGASGSYYRGPVHPHSQTRAGFYVSVPAGSTTVDGSSLSNLLVNYIAIGY